MASQIDRPEKYSHASGESFFPDYESANSESGLWSLLWDSIRHSNLDTGICNDQGFDLEAFDSLEFTYEDQEQHKRERAPVLKVEPILSKGLSKTARERKAAKERKVARLIKYRKNSKTIRTRRNKSGTRNPWSPSKIGSKPPIAGLIHSKLEDECSDSTMSTITADTAIMAVDGATHEVLDIMAYKSSEHW